MHVKQGRYVLGSVSLCPLLFLLDPAHFCPLQSGRTFIAISDFCASHGQCRLMSLLYFFIAVVIGKAWQ